MIRLGETQKLEIVKMVEFGVYVAPSKEQQDEKILLPMKQVPQGSKVGDQIEVFVYRDSKDRLIATTNMPKLQMGSVAVLRVAQTGKFGAFLDWGLEKDLMLPFKQQTFVAVDNQYSALIPKRELYGKVEIGQDIEARVVEVLEDGRLTLSIREKAHVQMEKDAEEVLCIIDSYDGVLPFNDKVSPEIIKRETGMSKNEFKRAIGNLYKQGKIDLADGKIRKK